MSRVSGTCRRGEVGAALVEFAVALPLLMTLVIGALQFGLTINNYIILTEAVRAGGRQLALSRGSANPCSSTVTRIRTAAPNLTGSLTITLQYNSGAVTNTSGSCANAALTASTDAKVTATYPCSLVVMGVNFMPGCTLTSQMTERIE